MAQITIYLEDALLEEVRHRAQERGMSVSALVAEAVRKSGRRLSDDFWAAVGTHPDFPLAEETRALYPPDAPRVPLD